LTGFEHESIRAKFDRSGPCNIIIETFDCTVNTKNLKNVLIFPNRVIIVENTGARTPRLLYIFRETIRGKRRRNVSFVEEAQIRRFASVQIDETPKETPLRAEKMAVRTANEKK
jgi:hypothetical protein